MAIVTTKSTTITNRDSTPSVINDARNERSHMISAYGNVAALSTDSVGSYYPLVSVPSSAVVKKVLLTCAAGGGTAAHSIGVFKNTANSGTTTTGVVANTSSDTFFAATQTTVNALTNSDVTNASGTYTADKRAQPIWQAIGLTTDPQTTFDIAIKTTTVLTSNAQLALLVEYADNSF